MAVSPADRFLEVIADSVALRIVRLLAEQDLPQAALVSELGLAQSNASRAIKALRAAGVVESDSPRGALRLRAGDEVRLLLGAANNLAEALLTLDLEEQKNLTDRTRRAAIRPTQDSEGARELPSGSAEQ